MAQTSIPYNWKSAFLAQSRSDFDVYLKLRNAKSLGKCHQLHYLQMALEKLIKYFSADPEFPPETRHEVSKFISDLKQSDDLMAHLGFHDQLKFKQYLVHLQGIVKTIDDLVPRAKLSWRNVEYPWEERKLLSDGRIILEVHVPAARNWDEISPDDLRDLAKFIRKCLEFGEIETEQTTI